MRILVVSNLYPPDFLGGYELACHQAAEGLRNAGHEVVVLTGVPRNGPAPAVPGVERRLHLADIYDDYSSDKLSPSGRWMLRQDAFGHRADNVHALVGVVESFRPEVAYVWNLIGLGGLGLLAALQHAGVPWVMQLGDCVPWSLCALRNSTYGSPPAIAGLARAFGRLCRGHFIAVSQGTLDEVEAGGVSIAGRTAIIPNWVVTEPGPRRKPYRPGDPLRILSAGQVATHKGVDILILAAKLLRDCGPARFEVDIYGNGDNPAFEQMIRMFDLEDRVRLRGYRPQDEIFELYARYDLFAFPTWSREPFGLAPMEALAQGCVPLVSRLCGFSEWFVDRVDCLKADRTPEAFAGALQEVIDGKVPLGEIAERGSRIVRRDFHIDAVLPGIEGELHRAIRRGGGPRHPATETHRMAIVLQKSLNTLLCDMPP